MTRTVIKTAMTEQTAHNTAAPRTEVRGMDLPKRASRLYHVWFSPKRRAHALQGDVLSCVLQSIDQIAREHHIFLIEREGSAEHVHLLLRLPNELTLPQAMRYLKGASARHIFQLIPELRADIGSNHFWQRGYGARSVEAGAIPTIRSYIRQHRSNDSGAADFSPRDGHLYEERPQ